MARIKHPVAPPRHFFERGHEIRQVSIRGRYHGCGPPHDMITREHRARGNVRPGDSKTKVVGQVARGVDGLDDPAFADNLCPVRQPFVWSKALVNTLGTTEVSQGGQFGHAGRSRLCGCSERKNWGAEPVGQPTGERGMVDVTMGDEHVADHCITHRGDQSGFVGIVNWTWIDHGNDLPPDQIAVRPGEGHRTRVRGSNAPDTRFERFSLPGSGAEAAVEGIVSQGCLRLPARVTQATPSLAMFNRFLKPYLPRSLFGRAFLILIVPIVLIQIVVGVVFVERLFQDVTRQMTRAAAIDVNYVLSGEDMMVRAAGVQLGLQRRPAGAPGPQDRWRDWIDISGAYVISTFRANVPGLLATDLGADRDVVVLTVERDGAMWDVTVPRSRVAAVNPHQLLVYMVLAAALLSIIAALFMANQVRPIRRLALAAEAFGKGQSVELYPRGASEVRAATNAFLSMRARIERQIEQRTAMLSGVSHDLRSPLTRLRLSLSLLDAGEEAALMGRDIDDMEAILDEFLAFARGDAGEESEEVAIKAFAKALAKNARRAGQELELVFDGQAADDPKVRMRRLSVQRGVSNLLANARKYASAARLTVYLGTGFIDFIVEDNGPGIARDAHETAMKPFSRLDAARNQDKGSGVGLGLAITADIARSHGGELSLGRSEQMGGLRANLRLPR